MSKAYEVDICNVGKEPDIRRVGSRSLARAVRLPVDEDECIISQGHGHDEYLASSILNQFSEY